MKYLEREDRATGESSAASTPGLRVVGRLLPDHRCLEEAGHQR